MKSSLTTSSHMYQHCTSVQCTVYTHTHDCLHMQVPYFGLVPRHPLLRVHNVLKDMLCARRRGSLGTRLPYFRQQFTPPCCVDLDYASGLSDVIMDTLVHVHEWGLCVLCRSRHTHVVVDRGVSWETAVQVYEQHLSDHGASESSTAGRGQSGFYCSRREQYHRHLYILALQKENSTHLFNIIRFINPRHS